MERCYLSFGGNLGQPLEAFQKAFDLLKGHGSIHDLVYSDIYLTSPVSEIDQPDYWNGAAFFQTSLPPFALMTLLKSIEQAIAPKPKIRNAPRYLDLDLLFYGDLVIDSEELTLPHPRWSERLFVLKPLSDLTDQVAGYNLKQMVETFPNPHQQTVVWMAKFPDMENVS